MRKRQHLLEAALDRSARVSSVWTVCYLLCRCADSDHRVSPIMCQKMSTFVPSPGRPPPDQAPGPPGPPPPPQDHREWRAR
eukprot:10147290-Lingulodinium_polyedra.AAC.2